MNYVSIVTEVISIKTTPTQRRHRANRNEHRQWVCNLKLTEKTRRQRNTQTRTRRTRRRSKPRRVRRINALQRETSSQRKSSRTSLHDGKSILKHIMRKYKVVNYVDKKLRMAHRSHQEQEARELHLPGYTGLVQRRGAKRTSRSSRRLSLNATRISGGSSRSRRGNADDETLVPAHDIEQEWCKYSQFQQLTKCLRQHISP